MKVMQHKQSQSESSSVNMGYVKSVSALCFCSNTGEKTQCTNEKPGIELKLKKQSFVIPTHLLAVNTDILARRGASF